MKTLIAIAVVFAIILAANNYMLKAIQKDALSKPKPRNKVMN
jgi:Na+-transporting NADH:ubiquinone oxidoreductase subunit NqrC